MKKLFGLALIGLMAGTAGAATTCTVVTGTSVTGSDSTCVTTENGASSKKSYDLGAITVVGDYYSASKTTYTKHCSNYTAAVSPSITNWGGSKAKCGGFEEGKTGYAENWEKLNVVDSSVVATDNAVATIDGEGETRLNAIKIPEDIAAASITYDRKFTRIYGVGYSTVTFPFSFKTECVDQTAGYGSSKSFAFYKAVDVDGSSVVVKEETSEVSAHQPYIVKTLLSDHTENGIEINYIKFKTSAGCSYTLKKNYDAETEKFVESKYIFDAGSLNGTWNFIGTYENVQFNETNKAGVYGFASKAKTVKVTDENGETKDVNVDAGSFVKAGAGASVPPMRAYLKFVKKAVGAKAAAGVIASIEEEQLPEVITVKFLDGDGETESIAQLNTRTGEIVADKDAWFDMKGRKLTHKPTVKGTYYNNGQKVIIK